MGYHKDALADDTDKRQRKRTRMISNTIQNRIFFSYSSKECNTKLSWI